MVVARNLWCFEFVLESVVVGGSRWSSVDVTLCCYHQWSAEVGSGSLDYWRID